MCLLQVKGGEKHLDVHTGAENDCSVVLCEFEDVFAVAEGKFVRTSNMKYPILTHGPPKSATGFQ